MDHFILRRIVRLIATLTKIQRGPACFVHCSEASAEQVKALREEAAQAGSNGFHRAKHGQSAYMAATQSLKQDLVGAGQSD